MLSTVQANDVTLCSSEVLLFEIDHIPDEVRRVESLSVLSLGTEFLTITDEIKALAQSFEAQGFRGLDALHLACASSAGVDYFCTCDDRLRRKAQALSGLRCQVVSLLDLVVEVFR